HDHRNLFAFRCGEWFEHIVGRVLATGRAADADPGAQIILGGERARYRTKPVVAAFATAAFEFDRTERQIEFVVHNHDLGRWDRKEFRQRSHRTTGQVHVRPRFGDQYLTAVEPGL